MVYTLLLKSDAYGFPIVRNWRCSIWIEGLRGINNRKIKLNWIFKDCWRFYFRCDSYEFRENFFKNFYQFRLIWKDCVLSSFERDSSNIHNTDTVQKISNPSKSMSCRINLDIFQWISHLFRVKRMRKTHSDWKMRYI